VIYTIDKEAGNAYIITNFHVVYDSNSDTSDGISDKISVSLWGDLETDAIPATFVGGSAIYDIAVLQVKGSERIRSGAAEAATVANSDLVQVGQTALAVGNPEAEGIAVTSGVVSVDSETITMTAVDGSTKVDFRVMRVDAPINSGNSGGGLYDGNGQLIGIVNAKVSSSSVENIGYAIPSNVAVAIAQNIIDYCADGSSQNVHRAIVGIQSPTVTNSRMIYDTETGLVRMEQTITVGGVTSGGLAEAAGVQAGDVLVSIQVGTRDALTITRQYQIIDEMLYARVGDTVTLVVERDGALQTVTMTITEACLQLY
jgi:serine protease Do